MYLSLGKSLVLSKFVGHVSEELVFHFCSSLGENLFEKGGLIEGGNGGTVKGGS
jgi:hypothetical protein